VGLYEGKHINHSLMYALVLLDNRLGTQLIIRLIFLFLYACKF